MANRSARERAARALCHHDGHPPDIKCEGIPMWQTYLDEVDVVLKAALPPDEFARLLTEGPDHRPQGKH